MRSSDLMGGELFIISLFFSFIADQQRAGMSASSARPMGGTDINYFFSFLSYSPAHQLIYEILICLDFDLYSITNDREFQA
jgi:hypothetical protein